MSVPSGRHPRTARGRLIGVTVVATVVGLATAGTLILPARAGTRRTVGQLYGVFPLPVAGPES